MYSGGKTMDFDVVSMKQRAKGLMKSTKPNPILAGLVILIFNIIMLVVAGYIDNSSTGVVLGYILAYTLLSTLLTISLTWFCMKVTREEGTVSSDIFIGFKEKQGKVLVIAITKGMCICIGYMFFFVGALIPIYCFRFVENIVKDDNTMNPIRAMGKSIKLLKGHYIELIKLDLSFIGWWILYIFTLGIAGVYVLPYTSMVYAEFYDYIKGQYEAFNA